LWSETADISNNGFYCTTAQPFAPGDVLTCLIELPVNPPGSPDNAARLYLEAKVDVVRIVVHSGNGFGIGCQIRDYRVINNQPLPAWAVRKTEQEAVERVIEQPA
jgi:hypothetical protein